MNDDAFEIALEALAHCGAQIIQLRKELAEAKEWASNPKNPVHEAAWHEGYIRGEASWAKRY